MCLALVLLVSDSSRLLHGESGLTSAGVSDASDSSLLGGRGMDMKLSVLTWGLLCNVLMAASLYVMGNLGLRVYDALDVAEQELVEELDESPCDGGSQLWSLLLLQVGSALVEVLRVSRVALV